jgi:hypothetical protein
MKSILIIVASFISGLVIGFYLSGYQIPSDLKIIGIILTFAPIITMGLVIYKTFNEWHKELVLRFGEITTNNEPAYYLQVFKQRGDKAAEDCEGRLSIGDIKDAISVWSFDNERIRTISLSECIRLFRLENNANFCFPSANSDNGFKESGKRFQDVKRPFLEYINKELTVEIGSKNGFTLKTTIPMSEILSLKNQNKPPKEQFVNTLKKCFCKK